MGFEKNVFFNCPFDDDYLPLLHPLLFTVVYLGLEPKIAFQSLNSAQPRIRNIIELIEASRFGIHDLSRLQAERKGEFFRLNMPFELGIDIGCQLFKGGKFSKKVCLILEAEKYRFQAALSDLSNSNIAAHGNEAERAVSEVRNWLNGVAKLNAPGAAQVWDAYHEFTAYIYDKLKKNGYSDRDIETLPVHELLIHMKTWRAGLPKRQVKYTNKSKRPRR